MYNNVMISTARVDIPFLNSGKYSLSYEIAVNHLGSIISVITLCLITLNLQIIGFVSESIVFVLELPLWSEGEGANSGVITTVLIL